MTDYEKLRSILHKQGMDYKAAGTFVQKLEEDEENFSIPQEKKIWALRYGFFPGRVELYNLNNGNREKYLPDYHYFMLHPLNHHFKIWINDKLTLKYILNNDNFKSIMPAYYAYVENDGSYTYLMDCPQEIAKDDVFLWNLLEYKRNLVLKPNSSASGGFGFIRLEKRGAEVYENNIKIDGERFNNIRDSIRNYVITEYVYQHTDMAYIWPQSECTLRVIMCKKPKKRFDEDRWTCLVSFARFGTSISGGTSNLVAGGVGIGFDYETGLYSDTCLRYKKFCEDGAWRLYEHPDSKVKWQGLRIPHWDLIKKKISELCQYISSLSYLGLDIVVTQEDMKILEINTLPALDYAQVISGPAMRNKELRAFFESKGINDFNGKDLLDAYLQSQK